MVALSRYRTLFTPTVRVGFQLNALITATAGSNTASTQVLFTSPDESHQVVTNGRSHTFSQTGQSADSAW